MASSFEAAIFSGLTMVRCQIIPLPDVFHSSSLPRHTSMEGEVRATWRTWMLGHQATWMPGHQADYVLLEISATR